ncbi:MAG: 2TM domain-containing protein [Leptolyngbyaceae cyanobacterium]
MAPLTSSSSQTHPTFSAEAVQAILSKALELRAADAYSAEQLQEMAIELNVSPQQLETAVTDWQIQQTQNAQPQAALTKQRRDRQAEWLNYALGSALLIGINFATAGTLTWAIFPVAGWGLGVVFGSCDRAQAHKRNYCSESLSSPANPGGSTGQ